MVFSHYISWVSQQGARCSNKVLRRSFHSDRARTRTSPVWPFPGSAHLVSCFAFSVPEAVILCLSGLALHMDSSSLGHRLVACAATSLHSYHLFRDPPHTLQKLWLPWTLIFSSSCQKTALLCTAYSQKISLLGNH